MPLLGLVLLAWIVSRLDLDRARTALGQVSASAVAAAAGWFSLNLMIKALRWKRMLDAQGLALPGSVVAAAFMAGQFYGQVTLGRLGELFRAEALVERGVELGRALSSCLFDRALDLYLVVALATVCGALVVAHPQAVLAASALLVASTVLGVAVLWGYTRGGQGWGSRLAAMGIGWLERLPGGTRLVATIGSTVEGLRPLARPGPLSEAMAWTGLGWLCYLAALWTLAAGMGIDASPVLLTAAASFAALSSLLPVTVSGLGARELIYMELLRLSGVGGEEAVVLALLHLAVMSGCAVGLGGIGLWARATQSA